MKSSLPSNPKHYTDMLRPHHPVYGSDEACHFILLFIIFYTILPSSKKTFYYLTVYLLKRLNRLKQVLQIRQDYRYKFILILSPLFKYFNYFYQIECTTISFKTFILNSTKDSVIFCTFNANLIIFFIF